MVVGDRTQQTFPRPSARSTRVAVEAVEGRPATVESWLLRHTRAVVKRRRFRPQEHRRRRCPGAGGERVIIQALGVAVVPASDLDALALTDDEVEDAMIELDRGAPTATLDSL